MPNFFVEADDRFRRPRPHRGLRNPRSAGEAHSQHGSRRLGAESFKPGQHAKVTVKLTDADGKPYVGSTVLSIFDKSVEYISGGTNVGDIKEFFWKWRRQHRPYIETNLDRWFANLVPPGQNGMETLGVFGGSGRRMRMRTAMLAATAASPVGGAIGGGGRRSRLMLGAMA